MRRSSLAGLTAVALTTGTALLGTASGAQAADTTVLYVNNNRTSHCSDSGTGTLTQPFCTISAGAAAATAGQTVDVSGIYAERATVTSSGAADQPITIRAGQNGATLGGPTAGFVVDGRHDIVITGFTVTGNLTAPAFDLSNATGITVQNVKVTMGTDGTAPVARLVAVTGSTLKNIVGSGYQPTAGVTLDAASSGNTITSSYLDVNEMAGGDGIDVAGSGNTIVNNRMTGWAGAAIAIEPGATNTVVANNWIGQGVGEGIRSNGATGTAITNNDVENRCRDLIRVDGGSSGASVQNNVAWGSTYDIRTFCGSAGANGIEIGVYGDAVNGTVVDYNNVYNLASAVAPAYVWGTPMTWSEFRTVSGQGAHDQWIESPKFAEDSANSAAPGFQATDGFGRPREDDPAWPNTGPGPVSYADRGAYEEVQHPTARLAVTLGPHAGSVQVDASASTPGFVPIGSYRFDFGDGTAAASQPSPGISHHYPLPGTYYLTVTVTGTDRAYNSTTLAVKVLRTGMLGLFAWRPPVPSKG